MSPGSHFISMSYTYSCSMHYVSPLSPGSHQASTPFTFSYFGRSMSPVSHRSHYMNHVKIYPFSDILCPQWPLGATLYQCHVLLTVQCAIGPHWAPGPTILHHPVHVAIPGVLGPQWAVGATVWYTSRSSNFQKFCVHNEQWGYFISMIFISSNWISYVSPVNPRRQHIMYM